MDDVATDVELLHAWRAGDRGAGRALFDRHFAGIHRFFHNKVATGVDDLVQQTFLACTEARDVFRGESNFRSWCSASPTTSCACICERSSG